jgi:hypothetical protein
MSRNSDQGGTCRTPPGEQPGRAGDCPRLVLAVSLYATIGLALIVTWRINDNRKH